MKKKVFFMMLILAGICFSCSKSDSSEDTYNLPEPTQQTRSARAPNLVWQKALISVIEDKDESNYTSDYIVYSAADDECFIFTEDEYLLAESLASMITEDSVQIISNDQLSKAPKKPNNEGWRFAGNGRGKLSIYKIAADLSMKIPKKQNFEIRVIYQKDGSYNVYWRPIR